jgi:hypothetical protein
MKYLISSSLFLVISACQSSYIDKYNFIEERILSDYEVHAVKANNYDTVKFKAYVEAYGYHISGIFVVKKTFDNAYKIGFINTTGLVLYSFEISKDTFQLFNCLEQLNNKSAIKIIENDLRAVLFPFIPKAKVKILSENDGEKTIVYITNGRNELLYHIENSLHKLSKIDIISNGQITTSISFQRKGADTLRYLNIKHYDYPLEIILEEYPDE